MEHFELNELILSTPIFLCMQEYFFSSICSNSGSGFYRYIMCTPEKKKLIVVASAEYMADRYPEVIKIFRGSDHL